MTEEEFDALSEEEAAALIEKERQEVIQLYRYCIKKVLGRDHIKAGEMVSMPFTGMAGVIFNSLGNTAKGIPTVERFDWWEPTPYPQLEARAQKMPFVEPGYEYYLVVDEESRKILTFPVEKAS